VTPGVDLVMQALTTGYESFFVVKERPTKDEVRSWSLPLTVPAEATVVEEKDGSVSVVAADGVVVSSFPAAVAWDAKGSGVGDESVQPVDLSVVAPQTTPVAGGDAVFSLVVTPDAGWLRDPGTVFPVTVDPVYTSMSVSASKDSYVFASQPSTAFASAPSLVLGSDVSARRHVLLSFGNASFQGLTVMSARLELWNTVVQTCASTGWLAVASSPWDASTTWNTRPAYRQSDGSSGVTLPPLASGTSTEKRGTVVGTSTACNGGPGWVGADVTGLVGGEWAGQASGTKDVQVWVTNESDPNAKVTFMSSEGDPTKAPRLSLTYSRAPVVAQLAVEGRGYSNPPR